MHDGIPELLRQIGDDLPQHREGCRIGANAMIDLLYEAFASSQSRALATVARELPFRLKLAPSPHISWGNVFGHDVTLAAPSLFAEAMPEIPAGLVRNAVSAHMFAVIEAFGTDRIEDGQVSVTAELTAVLDALRGARDAALRRVCPSLMEAQVDFAVMWPKTMAAMAEERALLHSGRLVSFEVYEATSLGKQSVGFPASLALAHAAGWHESKRENVYEALASTWLGLQMHDDTVDWEDDLMRGGAWAVALSHAPFADASGVQCCKLDAGIDMAAARTQVHGAGALHRMLARATHHYENVERKALALGARSLAAWATTRADKLETLTAREALMPGYATRAHALHAWAGEVLP